MFNYTRNPYVPEHMLYAVVTVLDYEGDVIEYFSNPESAAEVLDRVGGEDCRRPDLRRAWPGICPEHAGRDCPRAPGRAGGGVTMYDFTRTLTLRLQAGEIHGFSVSTVTGEPRTNGFAVGGDPECPEVRLSNFADMPSGLLTLHLDNYVTAVRMYGQGTVGGWSDGDNLYLDAPTIFFDEEDAEAVSRERGEVAYFNLNTMTENRTDA